MKALQSFEEVLGPDEKLLPVSQATWSRRVSAGLTALGIDPSLFTLGSLRGGGATEDFILHENLGRTQYKGRWRSPQSVGHYLQQALAILATIRLSSEAESLLDALAPLAEKIFPLPPSLLAASADCHKTKFGILEVKRRRR